MFAEVANRVLTNPLVRTPVLQLGKEVFRDCGRRILAIQQNPDTASSWAALARNGHKVVQFRDESTNAYIAVSVDGKVEIY
jgi:hypothetical protein